MTSRRRERASLALLGIGASLVIAGCAVAWLPAPSLWIVWGASITGYTTVLAAPLIQNNFFIKRKPKPNDYSLTIKADLSPYYAALGRYWGTAAPHRTGTSGGTIHGATGSASGTGKGARMIDQFSGIEFAAGVLRGTRSFKVDALGRLTGVSYEAVWRPGENEAECRKNVNDFVTFTISKAIAGPQGTAMQPPADPKKPHPLTDCKHGFYAYYEGSDDYHKEGYISAVIEGYGEAVIGTRGFRCMKARIVALNIPDDVPAHIARLVARNYPDIPRFDTFEQMVSEFPPDSAGHEYTPETDPDFWTRNA